VTGRKIISGTGVPQAGFGAVSERLKKNRRRDAGATKSKYEFSEQELKWLS
jgi:hypothetical protein